MSHWILMLFENWGDLGKWRGEKFSRKWIEQMQPNLQDFNQNLLIFVLICKCSQLCKTLWNFRSGFGHALSWTGRVIFRVGDGIKCWNKYKLSASFWQYQASSILACTKWSQYAHEIYITVCFNPILLLWQNRQVGTNLAPAFSLQCKILTLRIIF